ncbi:MAG: SIMPL domain-containing protein [Acetobacteraceae bacterium]
MIVVRRARAANHAFVFACLFAAVPPGVAPSAVAQPPPRAPAGTETVLRLAESAERVVRADELQASLRIQAQGASAAAVQQAVNRAMAEALERARAVPGVAVSTGGYHVWRETQGRDGQRGQTWRAAQELQLIALESAPALLELVGELQARGLTIAGLGYRVSRGLERRTREELAEEALIGLKARAARLSGVLGMEFAGFREIRVEQPRPPIVAMPRGVMAAQADPAAAPPPTAEPAEMPIVAVVEADAILTRR